MSVIPRGLHCEESLGLNPGDAKPPKKAAWEWRLLAWFAAALAALVLLSWSYRLVSLAWFRCLLYRAAWQAGVTRTAKARAAKRPWRDPKKDLVETFSEMMKVVAIVLIHAA